MVFLSGFCQTSPAETSKVAYEMSFFWDHYLLYTTLSQGLSVKALVWPKLKAHSPRDWSEVRVFEEQQATRNWTRRITLIPSYISQCYFGIDIKNIETKLLYMTRLLTGKFRKFSDLMFTFQSLTITFVLATNFNFSSKHTVQYFF